MINATNTNVIKCLNAHVVYIILLYVLLCMNSVY